MGIAYVFFTYTAYIKGVHVYTPSQSNYLACAIKSLLYTKFNNPTMASVPARTQFKFPNIDIQYALMEIVSK